MDGFEGPEDGSEERYKDRWSLWGGVKFGAFYHYTWWLAHNVVIHPLIGLFPFKPLFKLHDWSSHQMHNKKEIGDGRGTAQARPRTRRQG